MSTPNTILTQITRVQSIHDSYIRITLQSEELKDLGPYCAGGHLKLLLCKDESRDIVSQLQSLNTWKMSCIARTMTLCTHRAMNGEIEIEIALHDCDQGPAARWARSIQPGEYQLITRPKQRKIKNTQASWYLFVCDSCSLPAVKSAIRDINDHAHGHVIVHSDDVRDIQEIRDSKPGLHVHHIERDIDRESFKVFEDYHRILQSIEIPKEGIEFFIVGESYIVKEMKSYLVNEHQIDLQGMYTSPYWKQRCTQEEHKAYKSALKMMTNNPPEIVIPKKQRTQVIR